MADSPLRRLYEDIDADPAFRTLRSQTRMVRGAGSQYFPRVLFLGEAPGATEERTGQPFVGQSGALLNAMLDGIGLRRADVWITNAVKYRPPNNATPDRTQLIAARPYIRREIYILRPNVIATLGGSALFAVGYDGELTISRMHGQPFMLQRRDLLRNTWIPLNLPPVVPLYHPAAVLRGTQTRDSYLEDFRCLKQLAG